MEIVTKRFLLRDFREEDAAAFQEYHADPRSLEFYGLEEVKPGHAQQLLETSKIGRQKNQDATISLQLFNAKDHNYLLAAVDSAPQIPRQAKRSLVSSWRLSSGVVTDMPLRSCTP